MVSGTRKNCSLQCPLGKIKRDICTFDYSIRVMNNLERLAYRDYVFVCFFCFVFYILTFDKAACLGEGGMLKLHLRFGQYWQAHDE